MYSLANGRNRRTQCDITGLLKMSGAGKALMILNYNHFGILRLNGLSDKPYITLQRGVNKGLSQKDMRLWPLPYYNGLVELIKIKFPRLKLVLLGEGLTGESEIKGVDLDLRGRTNFEELKILLKFSALHIDGEAGMVHMKQALNGKSAVFFGPTSPDFFGYPNNINLSARACPIWCEWVVDDWRTKCLRGSEAPPPCLSALSPEMVMGGLSGELEAIVDSWSHKWTWSACEAWEPANPEKIVFIGRYDHDECLEYVKNGHKTQIYALALSPMEISAAGEAGYGAEFADPGNIPEADGACGLVVWDCADGAYANPEFALREMRRILSSRGVLHIRHMERQPELKAFLPRAHNDRHAFFRKEIQ
ncbi:MAG: hypothetical protein LBS31_09760 [Candidatus Adiutrix sp.]|nr:hypothetical protein [Candidatus Adiutrix sp.]